jgi:hypothetical protein
MGRGLGQGDIHFCKDAFNHNEEVTIVVELKKNREIKYIKENI